jgi:hypothetical protein
MCNGNVGAGLRSLDSVAFIDNYSFIYLFYYETKYKGRGRYLKKSYIYVGIIFLAVLCIIALFLFKGYSPKQANQLIYEYKQSNHNEFYFENGYVVFST